MCCRLNISRRILTDNNLLYQLAFLKKIFLVTHKLTLKKYIKQHFSRILSRYCIYSEFFVTIVR